MSQDLDISFEGKVADAVELVRHHPGVEHIWLNAFSCISPTDEFAADVGRMVIEKVMAQHHIDPLKRRHVVLRINAS